MKDAKGKRTCERRRGDLRILHSGQMRVKGEWGRRERPAGGLFSAVPKEEREKRRERRALEGNERATERDPGELSPTSRQRNRGVHSAESRPSDRDKNRATRAVKSRGKGGAAERNGAVVSAPPLRFFCVWRGRRSPNALMQRYWVRNTIQYPIYFIVCPLNIFIQGSIRTDPVTRGMRRITTPSAPSCCSDSAHDRDKDGRDECPLSLPPPPRLQTDKSAEDTYFALVHIM